MRLSPLFLVLPCLAITLRLGAQSGAPTPPPMQHTPGMQHADGMHAPGVQSQPTEGGQAAFAAIAEIVGLLEADTTTDWTAVDLEALRQHLIDMDAVTLRSRVQQTRTAGGLVMAITGDPTVAASIRRMVGAHAPMLEAMGEWRATASPIPGGMQLTVIASDSADTRTIARIRGLGFIGLMTEGAHHAQHHLMLARGTNPHAHPAP